MEKKLFWIFGILVIVLVLMLGCTTQSTNNYDNSGQPASNEQTANAPAETTIPAVTGTVLASAMDWYSLAYDEARMWKTDAKIIEARGNNQNGNKYFPINGETNEWTYIFVSVSAFSKYQIEVKDGAITDKTEYDEPSALGVYGNSPDGNAWVIDSTGAVDIVNTKAGGTSFLESTTNVKASYLLRFSEAEKVSPIEWTITYFPESYGQNFIVHINGENGETI
ncbi:MAG: hypothetical protein PHC66_03160 [Candidatus Nanoarchaeia archaeon]|nr:hypothetical protein [Candidatus Nanoarchaeia archaeon]MDD5239433.1 hypothetical protein [Candidatus Nanoarchaeia archaeon]